MPTQQDIHMAYETSARLNKDSANASSTACIRGFSFSECLFRYRVLEIRNSNIQVGEEIVR